jgi:hypothetical protein
MEMVTTMAAITEPEMLPLPPRTTMRTIMNVANMTCEKLVPVFVDLLTFAPGYG